MPGHSKDALPPLPGLLVVLSGPAGVGKSTVGERFLQLCPEATRSISATTRAPRGQERDGVDYWFYTREHFEAELARGFFLEHADVHGKLYGTPLRPVAQAIRAGQVVLLIIDVDGARQIREMQLDALLVFVEPPSLEELRRRLTARATESPEQVALRLARVEREMQAAANYDLCVVNTTVEACAHKLAVAIGQARKTLAERVQRGEKLYPGFARLGV